MKVETQSCFGFSRSYMFESSSRIPFLQKMYETTVSMLPITIDAASVDRRSKLKAGIGPRTPPLVMR